MLKLMLVGALGRMGRAVAAAAAEREDCTILCGVDREASETLAFPVYSSFDDVQEQADCIIDFSNPGALPGLLDYALRTGTPAVIATTGLSAQQIDSIRAASEKVPLFFSANMSLGVNLLAALAKKAAEILGDSFDIEIIEKHHNRKLDAPSGTALMLASALEEGLSYSPEYTYDRHAVRKQRDPHEIGIHAIRGGTIVGEHEILFAGRDEMVTLSHTALSREVFAVGALNAALFLPGQAPGLYSMKELVEQK